MVMVVVLEGGAIRCSEVVVVVVGVVSWVSLVLLLLLFAVVFVDVLYSFHSRYCFNTF